MASISMSGRGNAESIATMLSGEIQNSGLSCELLHSINRTVERNFVYIMVFEKYYMRSSNRASLTVVVTGDGESVCVDAIGSGGGQGAIFKFSWGAEENFIGTVERILEKHGFR